MASNCVLICDIFTHEIATIYRFMESVSKRDARRIILDAQGLTATYPYGKGPRSVVKAIDQLGYVQIDTISVVARAHHHILWTRNPGYQHAWLDKAQSQSRSVFEYWAHAAAYLPMADYRYSLPVMALFRNKKDRWPQSSKADMQLVMERIRSEGPLMSRDFESDHKGGGWWDWKPSKWALQRLFLEGHLMVSHRGGFQRVYDLPERIIPASIDTTTPTEAEYYAFLIRRTLQAQGIASRNALFHLRKIHHERFNRVLQELTDADEILPIAIENHKSFYAWPEALHHRIRLQPHISILSPFDNIVIWRKRLHQLFDFDYTLECYIPSHKRTYGYFCLPVLYKDDFVGRVDVRADRKQRVLNVQKMFWSEGCNKLAVVELLQEALERFAEFNGCERVKYGRGWK